MGELKIKPSIIEKLPKIEIQFDNNDEKNVKPVLDSWGEIRPIIKINDFVPDLNSVIDLSVTMEINKLPSFQLTVDDSTYDIRRNLKESDEDTILIFIGNKHWYLKFLGIIHNSPSNTGSNHIFLYGTLYNEKWYKQEQKSYRDKKPIDIFEELCKSTNSGLYVFNHETLDITQPYIINPNTKYINFMEFLIQQYTKCLWCYDTNGILYLGNIDDIRKSDVDKFKVFNNTVLDNELPIKISNELKQTDNYDLKSPIFEILNYSIQSDNGVRTLLKQEINRYNNFKNQQSQISKLVPQKNNVSYRQITVLLKNNIYEINPFSIVDLELYLPQKEEEYNKPRKMDRDFSGKKVVIAIEYIFSLKKNNNPNYNDAEHKIQQKLTLI